MVSDQANQEPLKFKRLFVTFSKLYQLLHQSSKFQQLKLPEVFPNNSLRNFIKFVLDEKIACAYFWGL